MVRKGPQNCRTLCLLILLAMITQLLAACAGQTPQPEATEVEAETTPTAEPSGRGVGDTLRILNPQAPTILNPHLTLSIKDWEACRVTYEPLASANKEGQLVPFLAAEIPSLDNGGVAADGKSVTWTLRQGVKWSDGEPFTAHDVLFTYQYVTNPDVGAASAALYATIENVEVIDLYTVKVNFKDVNPAWALPFVGVQGAIIPRHVFGSYNGPNAREAPANTLPVGTGPYRAISPGIKPQEVLLLGTQLVETNKIVFEPNPFYWEEDKPFFSRVEMRGGGTPEEAARLVHEGQTDYAYDLGRLDPEELAKLQSEDTEQETASEGQLVASFGSKVERILLNRTDPNRETADGERSSLEFPHPFFSDSQVRRAFAHAIDREAIAALYGVTGQPTTNNLVAPPQFSSPNTFYEFDLEQAKALLDEAGWEDTNGDGIRDKDGVKMKVTFQAMVGATVQQTQQIVKKDLESIGVEVELKIVDPAIMFGPGAANPDSAFCFNADLQEFSVRSSSPDPSAYMQYWTCNRIPQQANNWSAVLNIERWCNPEYDALHEQSTTEMDPTARQQLFIQMNDMLIKDVVMIPIVYLADAHGVNKTIDGVDLTPWDMNTWNIKDWRRIEP
jgi:peptide/nickel transport system substrate-binding protein